MTKEEIGKKLAEIRNGGKVDNTMTEYAIQSIEQCRSSYPVSNLVALCNALSVQLYMEDTNTGEKYPVDSVDDCHEIISFLMDRYETDEKMIYRLTGTHYTVPKGNSQHLSINTLYDVCKALKADLNLITK